MLTLLVAVLTCTADDPNAFPLVTSYFEGEVTGVRSEDGREIATVVVTKVLYSPAIQVGDKFEARSADKQPVASISVNEVLVMPALKVGQRSLWMGHKYEQGNIAFVLGDRVGATWPAHVENRENYQLAADVAQLVVTLANKPTAAERVTTVKELLRTETQRDRLQWLIGLLTGYAERSKDQAVVDYLAAMPFDAAMPMAARTQADTAMAGLRADTWRRSPERLKLLQSWMHNPPGRPDTGSIVAHLGAEAQRAVWPQQELIGLVKLVISDPENQIDFKSYAVRCLKSVPHRYDSDVPAFEWLMKLLVETKEPDLQFAAARTLTDFPLDVSRQVRLEQAVNKLGNAEAKKHVDYILDLRTGPRSRALVQ